MTKGWGVWYVYLHRHWNVSTISNLMKPRWPTLLNSVNLCYSYWNKLLSMKIIRKKLVPCNINVHSHFLLFLYLFFLLSLVTKQLHYCSLNTCHKKNKEMTGKILISLLLKVVVGKVKCRGRQNMVHWDSVLIR